MADTFAAADKRLEALRILEQLELQGDIRPDEQRILDRLRTTADADNRVTQETGATYRGFAQGATLGSSDEIGAAGRAVAASIGLGEPTSYSDALTGIRNANDEAREAAPDQFRTGQMVGGAATMALPQIGAMRALHGAGLGVQSLGGMATGTVIAGTEGFLSGEGGLANRSLNAADPAQLAIGAGTGGVAPLIGRGVGSMLADARAPAGAPVADLGFGNQASRLATRSFGDDAAVMGDVRAYLDGLGPEGMVADMGRNTRMQASGVTRVPGPAGQTITSRMDDRAQAAPERIAAEMDAVGGAVTDQAQGRFQRKNFRDQFSSPLYEAAVRVETPLETGAAVSRMSELISERAPGSAALKDVVATLNEDARPIVAHNLRSELSDARIAATRAGEGAKARTLGEAIRALDEQLDTIPGYAKARSTYADSKALDNAAELGAKFLKSSTRSDQLRYDWEGMNEPEREAFAKAARAELDMAMAQAVQEGNKGLNLIGPREMRAKIDIIFGDGAADKLAKRMDAEKTFRETRTKATQGSETAANQAAQREILPLVDDAGNRLGPIQRARHASSEPVNQVIDALLRRPQGRELKDLAEILTAQGPRRDQIVQALIASQAGNARNKAITSQTQAVLQALIQSGGSGLAISAGN